jgi:hypothetical protein
MSSFGPDAPGLPSSTEPLPAREAFALAGHEGAVLNVRFNRPGTYCLSCGKVG